MHNSINKIYRTYQLTQFQITQFQTYAIF